MSLISMHKMAGQAAALEALGLHKTANVLERLKDYLMPAYNTYVKDPIKNLLRDPRTTPNLADYAVRVVPHSLGGAAVGGISGALNADEGERLQGAGYGALTGGLLGAGIGAADAALMQHRGKGFADIIRMEEEDRQLKRLYRDPALFTDYHAGEILDSTNARRERLLEDIEDALNATTTQSMLAAPAATLAGSAIGGGMAGSKASKSDKD